MTYPLYKKRKILDLNSIWDFKFLEDVEFNQFNINDIEYDDRVPVPSAFDAFPAYNGKRGLGVYRCFMDVPSSTDAILKIGAAGMYCKVFADAKMIGEHYSAYTAFECKVPQSKNETRELVIMTCNRFDYEIHPLHEIFFDFYAYGGLFRSIELQILPDGKLIDWLGVDTLDYKTGKVKVTVKSSGRQNISVNVNELKYKFTNIDFSSGQSEFELDLKGLESWSSESPCLHTLIVDNGIDSLTVRFGIRQVWTEKGNIILNGKIIKLLGFCRHEAHPQYGPALPYQQLVADLQMLRDMGCNFVRGSHYPQDPRFLDLCDEMGFLVFEESMGWGQSVKHFTDPKFIEAQLKQTEEMINASYNHPSIIIRAFLNEGESNFEESRACYEALTKLIREKDPQRLVTYASNKELKDCLLDLVDVVCFNIYPGWYPQDQDDEKPLGEITEKINECLDGLKQLGQGDKPFIISEIGAGAIYGWRDPICAHWSEEYQDEYLKIVCNEVVNNENINGVALWQFCDCRTYRGANALKRPRAFNNKGIVDEYRRPKLAYKSVKKIFEDFNNNENK